MRASSKWLYYQAEEAGESLVRHIAGRTPTHLPALRVRQARVEALRVRLRALESAAQFDSMARTTAPQARGEACSMMV